MTRVTRRAAGGERLVGCDFLGVCVVRVVVSVWAVCLGGCVLWVLSLRRGPFQEFFS